MTTAFHGDPALKAALLLRLRRHAAAGTLSFGATRWDGVSGSAMGVSAGSEDSRDYADRFGYPLPLAALLDTVAACAAPARAVADVLAWVELVEPGTDLLAAAWRIADDLLTRLAARRLARPHHRLLCDLHARDIAGAPVARAEWTRLRALIEDAAATRTGGAARALEACAVACWPLRTSRSVLVELVDRWRRDTSMLGPPVLGDADRRRADAVLKRLWEETRVARDGGAAIDIPALFRARDPGLAASFEADLARTNQSFIERSHAAPSLILRHLSDAGTRTDTR